MPVGEGWPFARVLGRADTSGQPRTFPPFTDSSSVSQGHCGATLDLLKQFRQRGPGVHVATLLSSPGPRWWPAQLPVNVLRR